MDSLILGDALALLIDNRGKNPPFSAAGIPVVSAKHVKKGRLRTEEARTISESTYLKWMPIPLQRGDVVMTSEAPLGECALVKNDAPIAIAQRLYAMRGKPGVLDSGFLYYALQTAQVQDQLTARSSGTTVAGIRQPELLKIRVPDPGYGNQLRIAAALGALDEKITVNERISEVADVLIRADYQLFWRGSGRRRIGDVSTQVRNQVEPINLDPACPYVGLEHLPRRLGWLSAWGRAADIASAKSSFVEGDVLFGKLRPYFHKVVLAPVAGVCSTDILVARAKNSHLRPLLLAALSSDEIIAYATARGDGTRMPRISWADLASFEAAWPEDSLASEFADKFAPLIARVQSALLENGIVATLRDALLPKLVSGELRVRDAEQIVEDAT